MADWTTLSNQAVAVGGLPSGATVTALRDNPSAIAEGATGAPRNSLLSVERLTAGTTIRSRNDATYFGSIGDPETETFNFQFMQYGSVRVTVDVTTTSSAARVRIKRTRNGTLTTLVTYSSGGSKDLDVSVLPGDQITITREDAASVSNQRIQTNGENLWPGSIARLENDSAT